MQVFGLFKPFASISCSLELLLIYWNIFRGEQEQALNSTNGETIWFCRTSGGTEEFKKNA